MLSFVINTPIAFKLVFIHHHHHRHQSLILSPFFRDLLYPFTIEPIMNSNTIQSRSSNTPMMDEPEEDFNAGHAMSPRDPDNPYNWPLYRRVYVSLVSFAFGFAVLVSLRRSACIS